MLLQYGLTNEELRSTRITSQLLFQQDIPRNMRDQESERILVHLIHSSHGMEYDHR